MPRAGGGGGQLCALLIHGALRPTGDQAYMCAVRVCVCVCCMQVSEADYPYTGVPARCNKTAILLAKPHTYITDTGKAATRPGHQR